MTTNEFILRGYELYPEAALAVTTFQRELLERARGLVNARKEWGRFKSTRSTDVVYGDRREGWRVSYSHNGTWSGKGASFEVGYWWEPPVEGERGPIVFVALWGGPAADFPDNIEGISSFEYEGRMVLASPMPRDLDGRRLWNRQIDAALKALSAK